MVPSVRAERHEIWHFPFVQTRDAFKSVFQQVVVGKQFLGLHPIFPAVPGSHAFTVIHEKQMERKNGGRGKKEGWMKR